MNSIDPKYLAKARDHLIVALDVSNTEDAKQIIQKLDDEVSFYKIGLRLLFTGGAELAESMRQQKKNVFLDFKFYDIGAQVEWAAESAARVGGALLTIHSFPEAMRAAVRARNKINASKNDDEKLRVVAVTILTNESEDSLREVGISGSVIDNVLKRAEAARDAGCDGVVASAQEARDIRMKIADPDFIIVTPGIRRPADASNDQKRIATPYNAVMDGSTYLVVGRPITQSSDPKRAANNFIVEMARAYRDLENNSTDTSRKTKKKSVTAASPKAKSTNSFSEALPA